jgi:hypothetical protein
LVTNVQDERGRHVHILNDDTVANKKKGTGEYVPGRPVLIADVRGVRQVVVRIDDHQEVDACGVVREMGEDVYGLNVCMTIGLQLSLTCWGGRPDSLDQLGFDTKQRGSVAKHREARQHLQVILVHMQHFILLLQLVVGLFRTIDFVHDLCEKWISRSAGGIV